MRSRCGLRSRSDRICGGAGAAAAVAFSVTGRATHFAALAAHNRLSEMVATGELLSYGTNLADMFRQVGVYSGTILKGARSLFCNRPKSNLLSIRRPQRFPRRSPGAARGR